jgi:hypothetical protein
MTKTLRVLVLVTLDPGESSEGNNTLAATRVTLLP